MKYALSEFSNNGFFVTQIDDVGTLEKMRNVCKEECSRTFGPQFTSLENYHQISISREQHYEFQFSLFTRLNELKLHRDLVMANIAFFESILGPDIDIQTGLYIRISRPGECLDNIGLHRDTDYGNSAYEISFSFPLVDQEEGAGLGVVPGSHAETKYETVQKNRTDVEKGKFKNKMGFLYAPKTPKDMAEHDVKAISLNFGQALGFTLGLIHGQVENTAEMTRWSIDFRLKNHFHPLNDKLKDGYYSSLKLSSITNVAQSYYKSNPIEKGSLVFDASTGG